MNDNDILRTRILNNQNILTQNLLNTFEKGTSGLPDGTIKDWKGGKFIKHDGEWMPYESYKLRVRNPDVHKKESEYKKEKEKEPKISQEHWDVLKEGDLIKFNFGGKEITGKIIEKEIGKVKAKDLTDEKIGTYEINKEDINKVLFNIENKEKNKIESKDLSINLSRRIGVFAGTISSMIDSETMPKLEAKNLLSMLEKEKTEYSVGKTEDTDLIEKIKIYLKK